MGNYFHYIFKNPIKKTGKDRLESEYSYVFLQKSLSF